MPPNATAATDATNCVIKNTTRISTPKAAVEAPLQGGFNVDEGTEVSRLSIGSIMDSTCSLLPTFNTAGRCTTLHPPSQQEPSVLGCSASLGQRF